MPNLKYWDGSSWVDAEIGVIGIQGTNGINSTVQGSLGSQGTTGRVGTQGIQGIQQSSTFSLQGIQGLSGFIGDLRYTFSTTVTDADPGNGFIRFNNATIASVTQVFIDNVNAAGTDLTAWYQAWDNSTNTTNRGYLYLSGGNKSIVFRITSVTASGGYYKIAVAYISGSLPANNQVLSMMFVRSGNLGSQGVQGLQGTTGSRGPQGTTNTVQGTQGTTGTGGIQGTQGLLGKGSTLSAKGDIFTYSTDIDKLTVGSSGSILSANSSTTTGLAWSDDWSVGKNKLLNSDFSINQRNFTSTTADATYGFDRWLLARFNGTVTYSSQAFTAGTAPVAGYEGRNFARVVTSSQTLAGAYAILEQPIEDVRTLANQIVTVSFWAKAASGTPKVAIEMTQKFGSGGTPSGNVTHYIGQATISTSWARYSVTGTLSSLTGKTLGTTANSSILALSMWVSGGSDWNSRTGSLGIQNNTFDFWGVQVEAGSIATPFTTATGNPQAELAACQRYYFRFGPTQNKFAPGTFMTGTASTSEIFVKFPVTMRAAPTALEQSGTASHYAILSSNTGNACSAVPAFISATRDGSAIRFTQSGNWTAGNGLTAFFNNSAAYLGWSADLT